LVSVEKENHSAPETFEESFAKFQAFLAKNKYPTSVVWLKPADVVLARGNKIYVKLPVSPENECVARDELSKSAGLPHGVVFHAIGSNDATTFAYAWRPKNRDEALRSLSAAGVKFSAATTESRRDFVEVRNGLLWKFLRFRYRALEKYADEVVQARFD
jgi:hypothetical protein